MDWEVILLCYCADEAASERLTSHAARMGFADERSDYRPPNPTDDATRHRITFQIQAGDEQALEELVRERYRELLVPARSWECEAETDEHYAHFEGRQDEFGDVALDEDDHEVIPEPSSRMRDFLA